MNVERLNNRFGEDIRRFQVGGGMTVYLNPKTTVSKTYAAVATDFGSIDWQFKDDVSGVVQKVPDGVAHFLEHKLFEDEQGDISDRFAALGAGCNARTGFTSTCYLFTCTSRVVQNLSLLIDLVQIPYFPAQSVEREKGIIEQEISMYDDDAEWRVYFNLLSALYHNHPVRIDIAGTAETIGQITPDILYSCHRKFYHPANMVLAISGRMDVDEVVDLAERRFRDIEPGDRHRRTPVDEPKEVKSPSIRDTMVIARPKFQLGIKDSVGDESGMDFVRREIIMQTALDCLFGSSSDAYNELYDSGLIDDSFGAYYTAENTFGFTILGGDTDQPDALEEALRTQLRSATQKGIAAEDFERTRRRYIGRVMRAIDSVSANAHSLIGSHLADIEPYSDLTILDELTLDDVNTSLRQHVAEESMAVSMVYPAESSKAGS